VSEIAFAGVSHAYGSGSQRRVVLQDVDLTLTEQRIGIIGANGSGKSTWARMVNGLVVPSSGAVTVDGLDTRRDGAAVRRKVGFCFTDPDAQIIMPTVREDIAFGLRRQRNREVVGTVVHEALREFGLADHADHPSHLLSGGQKQMLALAAVLVTEPEILVLDEPTTLLDLRNTRAVAEVVAGLPQQVVLVTHDLDLVRDFDRVLVFDCARLVHDGRPDEAVARYRDLVGGAR
jgi:biotin transport system ATP-binding protein